MADMDSTITYQHNPNQHNADSADTKGINHNIITKEGQDIDMVSIQPAAKGKDFASLPLEVRRKIYRHAVGHQTIRIDCVMVQGSETDGNKYRIKWKHIVCHYKLSEAELHILYDTPVVFKNAMDRHLKPHIEPGALRHSGESCNILGASLKLDLRLLQVSQEFRREATEALY